MSDDQLPLPGPTKGSCEGNTERCTLDECPLFGSLTTASRDGMRRVRGCGDPVARGKRNKRKGQRKQARATTALGVPRSSIRPGHEEFLPGTVRIEVKAGAQVRPMHTAFLRGETQSEAARPFGDHRPFVFVAMPDGEGDGLVAFRLSVLREVVAAFVEQFGNEEGYQ